MLEPVRCPSCSTRYGLSAERVKPRIRRARCARCAEVFSIEETVARLLAAPSETRELPEAPRADLMPDLDSLGFEAEPESAAESLTLGDLERADEEILEQTLVVEPVPEAAASEELPTGAYSSAKDAISRLLGEASATPARPTPAHAQPMDVEAALSALDTTLGGVPPQDLQPRPVPAPAPQPPSGGTVRLGAQEIQAALGATRPLQAPSSRPAPVPMSASADPSLLKIQVGGETYGNVSLDQVTAWIEQGRVLEFHMVARQHSDNWIEAAKVPQLRPIFERMKRQRSAPSPESLPTPPSLSAAPAKRGLFGGFFKS